MRLIRISIRNYRGVEKSEVSMPSSGITLIEGPNEVGKSSLAEALDILLDFPHDSTNRRLEAVRPVHRSVGTEVEAEFTTGQYHLIYFKRWFHRPETRLQIVTPAPESLTARTAHDRVRAILDETLDWSLYRALRFIQGERVQQGAVGTSTTLVGALDRAASGGTADPRSESTLWEAIRAEWSRYFTPTGRVSQTREQASAQLVAARARASAVQVSLEEIENAGERHRDITRRLAVNRLAQAEATTDLAELQERSRDLGLLALDLQTLRADLAGAKAGEQSARQALDSRHAQAEAVRSTEAELEKLLEQSRKEALPLEEAQAAHAEASRRQAGAQEELEVASAALGIAQSDVAYRRAEIDHRLLSNRMERVLSSRGDEVRAQQFVDECKATTEGRKLLENALRRRGEALAALEVSSAALNLEAHAAVDLSVDGTAIHLEPGSTHRAQVVGEIVVQLHDLVTLRVTGGGTARELQAKAKDAENAVAELAKQLGLTSSDPLTELNETLEKRAKAEHDIEGARRTRADALEDLSGEELAAKVQSTGAIADRYPASRAAVPPIPGSLEEAEAAHRAAEERVRVAAEDMAVARAAAEAAERHLNSLRVQASANTALVASRREHLTAIAATLANARSEVPDETLLTALAAAHEEVERQEALLAETEARYAEGDPDGVEARLTNAAALMRRLQAEHLGLAKEQAEVEATLRVKGSSDLQAALDEAELEVARLAPEYEGLERRARAAKLLYETFARHRDLARQAYVAPYEEQIQRLARLVFAPDTLVRVDPDTFSVRTRTVAGVTVPFDSLSTGAREQLAVLARLACAILVNPDGTTGDVGVPVILDDALGNSDPTRLKRLAPAFAAAAAQAQVIIMTSTPDRYRQLGNVTLVSLRPS
ncbi:MAG: AAA family ATPase [Candidatus Dormibacteraeota bacterium]|nr:AAA family ATPase [Candidatus Dormibacteraeota bacterium]